MTVPCFWPIGRSAKFSPATICLVGGRRGGIDGGRQIKTRGHGNAFARRHSIRLVAFSQLNGCHFLPNLVLEMKAALEAIRAGHNDPRGLAEEVLAKFRA